MAYELDPTQPLDAETRRIALALIDHAIAQIDGAGSDADEAVHEVRKDCKKLRGLLRLLRPAAPALYKRENAAFREAAAVLSVLRDAEAALETYDALIEHFQANLEPEPLLPLREGLEAHKAATAAAGRDLTEQLGETRSLLWEARERVPDWELPAEAADDAGWSLLGPGLRKTYRRGRRAMRQAYAEPGVAVFHEWRKRAKYLRYQVRLLRPAWPHLLKPLHQEVKRLGDWLGDDHDLAVLEQVLHEAEALSPANDPEQILLALAAQRSTQLRDDAYWLGRRLYAEKPKHLDRRMQRYWQAARGLASAHGSR
ncbi:MAG: CHAD domain-containing protein [Gammaproteobacteria bacterium]|jgi:CHAD domain-containing protein|nr:CHAD domain-containing protein [Gammaproteobacteria bacterium]